ncbi:MAG: DUF4332 domain-containing protein [Planctomycetaceae bacterium]|nr:DUF4332 domain-containing protein [Planctomycetaceae bacterium]
MTEICQIEAPSFISPLAPHLAMSLYYRTLYAWKCKGTHHKLAMEALRLLKCEYAEHWTDLFLKNIESYLTGSKDPDKKFRDFRNHVLHVGENFWGGATSAATEWYAKARQEFADEQWKAGIYSAGVMSHYLTDIFCPLHTGQSEAENVIHRACEWSVSCSYDELIDQLEAELGGFPEVALPQDADWLTDLMRKEATLSHEHYNEIVQQYDFDKGVGDPPAGLNESLTKEFSLLLGRAAAVLAAVLDRCLLESKQRPPVVSLSLHAALSQATIPVFWITKNMADSAERKVVERIYAELKQTGKVVHNLPEENRVIAELIDKYRKGEEEAESVPAPVEKPRVKIKAKTNPSKQSPPPKDARQPVVDPFVEEASPFGARPLASLSDESDDIEDDVEQDKQHVTHLRPDSPIVDAPSIGPKTASRFRKINIETVGDFLATDPETLVEKLKTRWINAALVTAWQNQADLMIAVPGLRGHDAQLLTGVGVETWQDLAGSAVEDLLPLIEEYAQTSEGQRILRSGKIPDHKEVSFWIENAQWCERDQAA